MRLRKTLKSSTRRWLAPLFIAGVTGVLLASCAAPPSRGDNVAQINEAPLPSADASLLQGYISQTRVEGATVCYDMYDATIPGFSNTCDLGEASATSTANGSYTLTLDGFQQTQDYQLHATGGKAKSVTSTAEHVGLMLAPRGARNITPLTTMVALDNSSSLAAYIEATLTANGTDYSESYDVDIAKSGGTYGEHLRLAKGIEVFMYLFGRENYSLSLMVEIQTDFHYRSALTDLANELVTLVNGGGNIFDSAAVAAAIRTAAVSTELTHRRVGAAAPAAQFFDDIESAAIAVMNAVSVGSTTKQTEESIISACSSAFASTDLYKNWLQ